MDLELTNAEWALLTELLEVTYKRKLHELHHTATRAFKQQIRHEIETVEGLKAKLLDAVMTGALN